MGRLINPGVGELSDRLSILALKILIGGQDGKDVAHFQAESAAILVQLRTKELNGKWFEGYTRLAAVNACLWHAEDDLRALRAPGANGTPASVPIPRAITLAFQIQTLNDQRAEAITAINKETGELLGSEKLTEKTI